MKGVEESLSYFVIGFGRLSCVHIRHPANFTIFARTAPCTTLFTMQLQLHVNL